VKEDFKTLVPRKNVLLSIEHPINTSPRNLEWNMDAKAPLQDDYLRESHV
jgi:hypothetical protein